MHVYQFSSALTVDKIRTDFSSRVSLVGESEVVQRGAEKGCLGEIKDEGIR